MFIPEINGGNLPHPTSPHPTREPLNQIWRNDERNVIASGEENGVRRGKKMTAKGIANQMDGGELQGGRVQASGQSGIIVAGRTCGKGGGASNKDDPDERKEAWPG